MLIAKPELLTDPNVPKGVKRYFQDYAREHNLLGHKVLVVSQRLHWNHEDAHAYDGKKLGIGPVGDWAYEKDMPKREDKRDGVPPNTFHPVSLSTWLHEYEGDLVAMLYEVGERHSGCGYEDD